MSITGGPVSPGEGTEADLEAETEQDEKYRRDEVGDSERAGARAV